MIKKSHETSFDVYERTGRAAVCAGDKRAAAAGIKIIGGHTIDDFPPKYGLAVVGYVNPGKIITNAAAKPGDLLIITKPIGTGVILAGQRMGISSPEDIIKAKSTMKLLNRTGSDVMKKFNVRCATDITGFGLAGHSLKMARASNVTIRLEMKKVPLIGSVYDLIDEGCIPGASFRNLEYAEEYSYFSDTLDYNLKMAAFDAQTSGGLFLCIPSGQAEDVLKELGSAGFPDSSVIGTVTDFSGKFLYLDN
jgi:selenide,water dikinase